jgi:hypothetical protein
VSLHLWNLAEPIAADFERRWNELIRTSAHASFWFDPACLRHAAAHGEPGVAALDETGDARLALVVRFVNGEARCGWPWRWHVVIEGTDAQLGPNAEQGARALALAERLAGNRRLRCYLPAGTGDRRPQYTAGATVLQAVLDEDAMKKNLDGDKRRSIPKAGKLGYRAVVAERPELFQAFARIQHETETRHGKDGSGVPDHCEPGEGWREWELPWMKLIVAIKDDAVVAGSGFGLYPGATLDYRANASTEIARREGANVLLAWEAMRFAARSGYRWINWCGATRFKRDLGGTLVPTVCHLGGGAWWTIPNTLVAASRRAQARVGAGIRELRRRRMESARAAKAKAQAAKPGNPLKPPASDKPRGATPDAESARWDTNEPLTDGFRRTYEAVLAASRLSNFTLDPAFLEWEAQHGRRALALVLERPGVRAAAVLRVQGDGYACGWPWRWQIAIEGDPEEPAPEAGDARWVFEALSRATRGKRLHCFLPVDPPDSVHSFPAGSTIFQSLRHTDEELLEAMHESKQRLVRNAIAREYQVREADTAASRRAFRDLQKGTMKRRGIELVDPATEPLPGEGWREWELPWMWLLVAERRGRIEAGIGDGSRPGGVLDGRTGASSNEARRDGAFALLCWEEARRGRDRSHRWLNHGGDTAFRRDIAGSLGSRLAIHCWLGGGAGWSALNASEAWLLRARPRVGSWVRSAAGRAGKAS